MNQLTRHVDELFKEIPESKKKDMVLQEVLQNLQEKVYDLMDQGKDEEDAINKAIVEFGDIEDLKNEIGYSKPLKSKTYLSKLRLGYSIWGSLLIISLFVFINLYYTPHVIWFVYPTFAILWWPLTMYFSWLKGKKGE